MSLENVKSLVSAIAGSVTLRWRFHRVQLGKTAHVATAPKKRTVGTPLSDAIYQVAHEWAYSRFITNMAVIERDADQVTLELCHTWRITRTPPVAEPDSPQTPVWTFTRWNPLEGLWEDVEASHIPALPLFQRGRGGLARNLIGQACAHYTACAVTSLRAEFVRLGYTDEDINDGSCLARDILCEDRVRHKERYEPLAVAGGIVGAAIWQLLDRPSVSHAFRVYPMGELRLQEYLVVERHGAALDKIHREHPNAMPILRGIDPRHWGDANLFAYYRWADIRTTPLIGQRQISSKLAWKAFIAAPATAHSAWMRAALSENSWLPFDLLYEVLGRCRRSAKATWICKVILAWRTRTEWLYTTTSQADYTSLAHLCDAFFAHAATLSRKPGATVASQLDPSEMANILDWWADDGCKRALPDAQSTWASIARQVVRWERAKREGDPNKRWQSALGQTTIDDVLVVPLASEPELVKEGSEMHHCVGTYARVCMTHGHRIFSLRTGAERSTLRIVPHGDEWHVGENLAQCNDPPTPELLQSAERSPRPMRSQVLPPCRLPRRDDWSYAMRKRFACGHRGLGCYCHRCQATTSAARNTKDRTVASRLALLRERERHAPIGLEAAAHLPAVLERALDVLACLDQGAHPLALGARRLTSRHGDFSIAIGQRYRLLIYATTLKPLRFMSHETYNGVI